MVNAFKIVAIALIVAGALGLAYGSVSYRQDTQRMELGTFSLTVTDQQTIAIPLWAGIAAIAVGGTLLLMPAKNR